MCVTVPPSQDLSLELNKALVPSLTSPSPFLCVGLAQMLVIGTQQAKVSEVEHSLTGGRHILDMKVQMEI